MNYKEYIKLLIQYRISSLSEKELDDCVSFIFNKSYSLEHIFNFSCPIKYISYIKEMYENGTIKPDSYMFLGNSIKVCQDSFGGTQFHNFNWDVKTKQTFVYTNNNKIFLIIYQPE